MRMVSLDNGTIFNDSSISSKGFDPLECMPPLNCSGLDVSTYIADFCQDGNCDFDIDEVYEKLRRDDFTNILVITILLSVLGSVGTLGNLFVLLVFSQRFTRQTSTYFILSLAAIDLVICSLVIPGLIVKTWYHKFYFDWLCKLWEMLRMYSLPTSAFLLVAIAFDRYFLICMATTGLMTKKRAKIIIAVTVGLGLALSIPPLLAVGVYQIDDDGCKTYRGICIANYGLISVEALHKYWIFITALFCAMIIIIATLYIRVFMTVYRQSQKWKRLRKNKINLTISEEDDVPQQPPQQSSGNESDSPSSHMVTRSGKRGSEFEAGVPRRVLPGFLEKLKFWKRSPQDRNTVFFIRVNAVDGRENRRNRRRSTRPTVVAQNETGLSNTSNGKLFTTTCLLTTSGQQSDRQGRQPRQSVITLAESPERSQFQRRAHIQMAHVLFTVTLVYIISFLPTFLVTYQLIPNEVIFYVYFINNAANPIVYSFMNKKFRCEVGKMFTYLSSVCRLCSYHTKK